MVHMYVCFGAVIIQHSHEQLPQSTKNNQNVLQGVGDIQLFFKHYYLDRQEPEIFRQIGYLHWLSTLQGFS